MRQPLLLLTAVAVAFAAAVASPGQAADGTRLYREPDFTDPVIRTAIEARLAETFGGSVKIQFTSSRAWSLRAPPEDLPTAKHLVIETLKEASYAIEEADGVWRPDYYRIAAASAPLVKSFAQRKFTPHRDALRAFVEDVTAYAQTLPYVVPAEGFLDPAQVMSRGHGDCDSKAVLAAAMFRSTFPSLDPRFVVFPDEAHAMLAVDIPPLPGEYSVPVGARQYVILEVAGPGRFGIGRVPKRLQAALREGRFEVLAQ